MTTVNAPIKEIKSKLKIKKSKTIPEPTIPVITDSVEGSKEFSKQEKEYIYKLVSDGYHYRDIIKKCKFCLKLDSEKISVLEKNVKTSSDILKNLENM